VTDAQRDRVIEATVCAMLRATAVHIRKLADKTRHNTAEVVPADVALYRLANSFDREAANRI
jgi:hypothetical protein